MTTRQIVRFHTAIGAAVLLALLILGLAAKPMIEEHFRLAAVEGAR